MADGEGGGSVALNIINHNKFVVFQIGPGRNTVSEIISKPVVAWKMRRGSGPAGPGGRRDAYAAVSRSRVITAPLPRGPAQRPLTRRPGRCHAVWAPSWRLLP